MTITTSVAGVDYDGDGSDVSFPTTFYFQSNSHVTVSEVDANGAETAKTEGAHYTLTGAGVASGGTVTMTTAPAVGVTLRIRRTIPLTQPTAFSSLGTFSPATHEAAFDRVVMQVQQVQSSATDLMTDVRDEVTALRDDIAADPSATALDARTVLASGATTARTLAAVHADYINVLSYGVSNTLTTDQTTAFHAAITAAKAAGKAVFCPAGTYYVNLVCTGAGVTIFGVGGCTSGGTIFTPYDNSLPCVSIGDGVVTTTAGWQLHDIRVNGTGSGATSDGIKINGSQQSFYSTGVWVNNFGRYNIHITSTPAAPTSYVWFDKLTSNNGNASCFYVDYGSNPAGGSYTTAIGVSQSSFQPKSVLGGTDTSIYLSGVIVWFSDVWVECGAANHGTRGGYVYLTQQSGAPGVGFYGSNTTVDTASTSNHCFFVNETPATKRPSQYLVGSISSQGRMKWLDASYTSLADELTRYGVGKTIMTEPVVSYRLGFGNTASNPEDISSLMVAYRDGDGLKFEGGPFRVPGSLTNPFQMQAGGAMWRDSDAMLRFTSATYAPAADSDGWLVGMKVGVPASAAASGKIGQWAADTSYVYICVAANTWMRAAIATW